MARSQLYLNKLGQPKCSAEKPAMMILPVVKLSFVITLNHPYR
jgi:hypothetical protein